MAGDCKTDQNCTGGAKCFRCIPADEAANHTIYGCPDGTLWGGYGCGGCGNGCDEGSICDGSRSCSECDLTAMAATIGTAVGDEDDHCCFDMDGDGDIDFSDFGKYIQHCPGE